MWEQILAFLLASMALTISPGPDIIYVLSQSLVGGKLRGFVIALGLVSGIIFHTTLVAFGVSAIIKSSETLFWSIKIAGAVYLLYLAYKVYANSSELKLTKSSSYKSLGKYFKTGLIMNLLNPKVSLFFLAFFPGFLWSTTNTVTQFYILGFIFMLQALLIFGIVATLSDRISNLLMKSQHQAEFFKWFQISIFILIAILILF
ncbi:LysE family translocator [Psychroflexus aestuariivivens]|uniref:LysE family translocator n=1 Tax=Psychroflexus aestuariivivens TaxID=1795040 RepID=UPI000FD7EC6C|nr:LysE family translocator [Psychroflexus aestuariivivens]